MSGGPEADLFTRRLRAREIHVFAKNIQRPRSRSHTPCDPQIGVGDGITPVLSVVVSVAVATRITLDELVLSVSESKLPVQGVAPRPVISIVIT